MQEAKKTKRKTEFERMFPGVTVDTKLRCHLTYFGKACADYNRDVETIKEMLDSNIVEFDVNEKLRLQLALKKSQENYKKALAYIEYYVQGFVCPKKQSKIPSDELNITDIFNKYDAKRLEIYEERMNDAIKMMRDLIRAGIGNLPWEQEFKAAGFKNPPQFGSRLMFSQAAAYKSEVKYWAKKLGRDPSVVLMDVDDNIFARELTLEERIAKLKTVNAKNAYRLLKSIEKDMNYINSVDSAMQISLDYQDAVKRFQSNMDAFKKETGFTYQEWLEHDLKTNMLNWDNQKKR